MKRVLTALILAPLVLALVFLGPKWSITAAVALVAVLAAWEMLGLAERCGAKPPRVAVMVAIVALFAGNYQFPEETLTILGFLSLALLVWCTFFTPLEWVLVSATACVFTLVYVGLTLIALPMLRDEANGPSLVVFLLCVVWAGDIAALYIGRALGRHRLAPSISPNKTWEGAVGSVLGSMAMAGALLGLSIFLAQWNSVKVSYSEEIWWYWLAAAAIVNVAAQFGDLVESALKRAAGVKDSGNLLPGHGGVLDRIDALLLAAPALWYAQIIHLRF